MEMRSSGNTPRQLTRASLRRGARQLADADPDLDAVLGRLGEPPMWGRRPGFSALVRIILEQQVSLASARAMYRRLAGRLGGMTPKGIYALQLALALREVKRLDDLPTKEAQEALAGAWAPWRSVAARPLWAHYLAERGQFPPRPGNRRFEGLNSTPRFKENAL